MEQKELTRLLEEELRSEIENLARLEPGSKEHSEATECVVKLYKLNQETIESEREFQRKCEESVNQDFELKLKETQLVEQVKSRRWGMVADVLKVATPAVLFAIVTFTGYKLEYVDQGIVGSPTLKGILGKIRPN